MPNWPSELSPRFAPDRLIGTGGMGVVWLAEDLARGEQVAVKFVPRRARARAQMERRLLREAQALHRTRHPNVVGLRDYIAEPAALVMDFVDGAPLLDPRLGDWHWSRLQPVLLQLLDAIAFAHSRGVIHRDLKPDNIIVVTRDGREAPIVIDFGLALVRDVDTALDAKPAQAVRSGTARYMPREQLLGDRALTPQADLHALGVVLYELTTGQLPWTDDDPATLADLKAELPPRCAPRPALEIPAELVDWIMACLAPTPMQRPLFAADMRRAIAGLPSLQPPVGASERDPDLGPPTTMEVDVTPSLRTQLSVTVQRLWHTSSEEAPPFFQAMIREAPLVGRHEEREYLRTLVERALSESRPHGVLLYGPIGIGKSRLLHWLRSDVSVSGRMLPVVADHRSTPSPAAVRHALLHALGCHTHAPAVEPVADALATLACPPAECARIAPRLSGVALPEDELDRWRTCAEVIALLAARRPVCLMVDGLNEESDAQTVRFLEWLVTDPRLSASPVVIIGALRAGDPMDVDGSMIEQSAVLEVSPLETWDVEPLTHAEMTRLLRSLQLDHRRATQLAPTLRGNPLLAVETLWTCGVSAAPSEVGTLEDQLARVLSRRLASLRVSDERLTLLEELLRGISVGPSRFTLDGLEQVVAQAWSPPAGGLASLLWLALGEGFLAEHPGPPARIGFRHELLGETIRAGAAAWAGRAAWQRGWDTYLKGCPEDPFALMQRARVAAGLHDDDARADWLLRAGRIALETHELTLAERAFADARELKTSSDRRAEAWIGAAMVAARLTQHEDAASWAARALGHIDADRAEERVVALALRAHSLAEMGRTDDASAAYSLALKTASAGPSVEIQTLMRVYIGLAELEVTRSEYHDAESLLRRAARLARDHGAQLAEGRAWQALGNMLERRGLLEDASEVLEAAVAAYGAANEPIDQERALLSAARTRAARGDHERARDHFGVAIASARRRGSFPRMALGCMDAAQLEIRLGDVPRAQGLLTQCAASVRRLRRPDFRVRHLLLNAQVSAMIGDERRALEQVETALAFEAQHPELTERIQRDLHACARVLAIRGYRVPALARRLARVTQRTGSL